MKFSYFSTFNLNSCRNIFVVYIGRIRKQYKGYRCIVVRIFKSYFKTKRNFLYTCTRAVQKVFSLTQKETPLLNIFVVTTHDKLLLQFLLNKGKK